MRAADPVPASAKATQRLDKWLWFVRIVKTRTLAATLVASGKVRVNRQRVTKPGYTIRCGDVITVSGAGRIRVLKVAATGVRRGPSSEAAALYEDIVPAITRFAGKAANEPEMTLVEGTVRPTKRERRQLRQLTGKGRTTT